MKKYFLTILSFILIFNFIIIFNNSNYEIYAYNETKELVNINDMENLINNIGADRTAYSQGEKQASNYLASVMQSFLLSQYKDCTNYTQNFKVDNHKSQNIIGVKKSSKGNAKQVILGAHYDNVYSINNRLTYSNGVLDNGSGIVCLIAIMKELQNYSLPFDVIYIFYGAEETGINGSKYFTSQLTKKEIENTILALNFDSIGVGDYNYFYCGESATSYKSIFKNDYNIKEIPKNKRINLLSHFENYAYTHTGLMSDISSYLKNGIKCTTFFSGNLSHNGCGYLEYANQNKISHTKKDNLTYIKENYPNFIKDINNVANLSVNTLSSNNFIKTMNKYENELNLSYLNNKYIVFAIFLLCLFILIAIKPKEIIMSTKTKQ